MSAQDWDTFAHIGWDFMIGCGTICMGVCFIVVACVMWRGCFKPTNGA